MCGRFYVAQDEQNELLAAMIREASRRQRLLTGQQDLAVGEVLPGSAVAALAVGKTGQGAYPMRWGFQRASCGLLINVRSETAAKKFAQSVAHRRCLIPISWYFEWQTLEGEAGKRKIKYAIRPRKAAQMYLAGLYRYEEDAKLPALSVLTREAAPGIAFIHPRMPVILPEACREAWLMDGADAEDLMAQSETDMECWTA